MSITLQAIVLVAAVVALSVVAVDSLDIWEWEKFAQNDGTVSEYTADKSVYASDADAEKSATISVTGTATASVDPDIFTVRLGVSTQDKNAGMLAALLRGMIQVGQRQRLLILKTFGRIKQKILKCTIMQKLNEKTF